MKIFLRFWIKKESKNFLGKGKVELLEHIKTTGSISKAAKNMRMSYKAAWDSVDSINHLALKPFVQSVSGGKGGGGTMISPCGEKAIEVFKRLENVMKILENHLGDFDDLKDLEEKIVLLEKKLSD